MEKTIQGKWAFIVNPVAGNGYSGSLIPEIEKIISRFDIMADIFVTESKGHAPELVENLPGEGYTHFIGVGGDGTMNEIIRPLLHQEKAVIGTIPAGTGNDFIQILGWPDRYDQMDWNIFFEQHTMDMDVGVCNGMPFINGMGLGFDAQVAAENYSEPGVVKKGGKNKYIWHIVKTLLFYREQNATICTGNEKEVRSCFINTIANGRRFAGGFYLTPKAIANDGLLDVCSIQKLSLLHRFRILPMVPKGTHLDDQKVAYTQTDHIHIEFDREVPYHLDGELFFSSKFDVKILPGKLRFMYNPKGEHYFTL
jgi:YegS/Rv2252/BmrU family lipid kinase